MYLLKKSLFILGVLLLSSCSHFSGSKSVIQNRDTDYLKAKSIPPLRIPPGISSSTMTAHYPVSDREYPGSNVSVDLTPPELNTSKK